MASSAFKSTSKRTCDVSPPANMTRGRNAPVRRTRSRSVVSRPDDIQFSNKRDNPLFSSSQDETADSCRSRRFRSLSRNPSPRSRNAETETEQECDTKELLIHSNSGSNNMHLLPEPSDILKYFCSQVPNWDDGGSGIYFSEAEEQTINEFTQCILSVEDDNDEASSSVCETGGVEVIKPMCDIPDDRVNGGTNPIKTSVNFLPSAHGPGPVEIVLDIRREYVKELERSEERARKLRADLAAEEHHGLELGRVLKELLPDSRVDSLQRHRLLRKNISERRRMSKRLTDEALAYFDECISISTFDSSDLSSLEDPPSNLQASAPYDSSKSVAREYSTFRTTSSNRPPTSFSQVSDGDESHNQVYPSITANNNGIVQAGSSSTVKSKSYNTRESRSKVQEKEILYNNTDKENEKHGFKARTLDRQVDIDDYNFLAKAESLLLDKILLKTRIDSGSVYLSEGVAFSTSSFIF